MTARFRHRAFGLTLDSELPLPAPAEPDARRPPDMTVRLGRLLDPPSADAAIADVSAVLRLCFRESDRWEVHASAPDPALRFTADVRPGRVEVAWTQGVEPADVAQMVVSVIVVARTYLGGGACLHGSAVVIDGRAALILGQSGRGKSTLTAAMVAQGARLLSEEILVLGPDRLSVLPGVPAVKISDGAARALGVDGATRPAFVHADFAHDGVVVDLGQSSFCPEPTQIGEVYLLGERHAGAAPLLSDALSAPEAVSAMAGAGYWMARLPLPARAAVMRVALEIGRSLPVRLLSLPDDLATLPYAARCIVGRR